jgi:polysaccharide export outer membrane protein
MICKVFKAMIYITLPVVFLLVGCIPQKQTVYLQGGKVAEAKDTSLQITDKYFLMPNDYLYIRVSTMDPKISEFFNLSSSQGGAMQSSAKFMYYPIDNDMNIDFPFAGKINLKGCNLPMAKEKIKLALQPYLKEANLIVRLSSTTYTILGEVRSPGVKSMERDQMTIFDAVAQAGDMTTFAKRKKVILVRKTAMGEASHELDLTRADIINSEYYYIYPNDLIYIRPMKARQWGIGESFSFGIFTSLLATYIAVISLTK